MPRHKSFDPNSALRMARDVFWEEGYDAASISMLERRMGINRVSIYDTFGDKKSLYLRCLTSYSEDAETGVLKRLLDPGGLRGIRAFLAAMVDAPVSARRRGCLMVNSQVELSGRDRQIDALVARHFRLVDSYLRMAVDRGKANGEIRQSVATRDTARMLLALAHGVLSLSKSDFGRPVARSAISEALNGLVPIR